MKCKKRLESTAGVVTYNEVAATVLGKTGQRIVEVLLILSQSGGPCSDLLVMKAAAEYGTAYEVCSLFLALCCLLSICCVHKEHSPCFSLLSDSASLGIIVRDSCSEQPSVRHDCFR